MNKSPQALLRFSKLILILPLAVSSAWSADPPRVKFDHVHTYAEVVTYLTQVVETYPQITRLHTIGKSYLGKDLLVPGTDQYGNRGWTQQTRLLD